MGTVGVCRCGHDRAAHDHYRTGTDCAICGKSTCPRFRSRDRWRLDWSGLKPRALGVVSSGVDKIKRHSGG